MTKAISTAGRAGIQVEYDVMARLNAPPAGSPSGSCVVLEGSSEDKLVVYYSSTGTNGPWTVAQSLSEGGELPTDWTRKLINLAGVNAVGNNANFALRFQWQFNSGSDTGRIDNVHLLSGAVTAPTASIGVSVTSIDRTIQAGQNLPGDLFRISNTGEGNLNFTVTGNVPWLSVSPASGSSVGPERTISINYAAANLSPGDYASSILITSTNAANSPQSIMVKLHVIPALCFWEPFDYYNGNLTTMGVANWTGSATGELQTDSGTLKIVGGAGLFSASHPVNCVGSNGVIAVGMKIRKGIGSGDFFWNVAIDDATSNNLARWYGGSTIARGRVGNTITSDINLSGVENWDDLYIKIDTAANTSEFFFNGISYGAIAHGTTPGNSVGVIRFERLDRLSAANDQIYFDNVTIGSLDTTPPPLNFSRSGVTLSLSWPAIRTGAKLESTTNLSPPALWTTITNNIMFTNGSNIYMTSATNVARFFHLGSR